MSTQGNVKLSEAAQNIIENLACRIAEKQGGTITPNHLIPYLPVSLAIIKSCLAHMVDETAVFSEQINNITQYEFSTFKDTKKTPGPLKMATCVSCDADISSRAHGVLCAGCFETLKKELNVLAEKMGWPAQAVYEHEILYLASSHGASQHAETLAGHSRYTLKRMRAKLDRMSVSGYLEQGLDQEQGTVTYKFPEVEYPKDLYKENMGLIRAYPASVMEEVQLKLVRILFSLGFVVLALLVLAFFHVPLPILVLLFLIIGPGTAIFIWRRKGRPEEE